MKISTKGRYALRMLLDLASHPSDEYIALKDIAARQDISKKYLEQIVPVLNRAGILHTNRGFQGGYRLAVNPEKITVRDITEESGISRNTFYYHYQDIPALLEDILDTDADRFISEYPRLNSIEECLEAAMQFARANKRVIMHIFRSGNNSNMDSLWRICEHMISTYAGTVFPDSPLSESDRRLFIRYHKCTCFGLVTDWINSGMDEAYVDDMRRICQLKRGSVDLILRNAAQN